jgi:hypothetical protein
MTLIVLTGLTAVALPVVRGQLYTDALPIFRGTSHADAALNDLTHQALPYRLFYQRCLRSGDSFLWCPDVQCGFDLHGEGQAGMCHPLHLLVYRLLPLQGALEVELLLNLPLTLLGMVYFLRRWKLGWDVCLFGGMAFAFSGYILIRLVNPNAVDIIAHYPWLLLAVDVAMREPERGRAAWGLPAAMLLVGSMVLCGYPQYVAFAGILAATYGLAMGARRPVPLFRLSGLAAAGVVGLLIGAVQLLPTYNTLSQSYRESPTYEFMSAGSLNPLNILQVLAPYLYERGAMVSAPDAFAPNEEFTIYHGAALSPLLIWLIARRRGLRTTRPLAIWAATLALFALVLALGRGTPLFALYSRLPGVGSFRMPVRHIVIVHFCTSILAAIAYADLATLRTRPSVRLLGLLLLPALASFSIAAFSFALRSGGASENGKGSLLASSVLIWMGPVLVGVASALVAWAAWGSRLALVALATFLVADLVSYAVWPIYCQPPNDPEALAARLSAPPAYEGERLGSIDNLMYLLRNYRLTAGYVALTPRHRLNYADPLSLRIAGATWDWRNPRFEKTMWVPVPDPLPRARLLNHALMSHDPARDLRKIDPARTALVDSELELSSDDVEVGTAQITVDRPGEIEVSSSAPGGRLLVVSERFTADWQATVDGHPGRVLPVYGDFLGCVVEGGNHEVIFRYSPRSFHVGLRASIIGLAIVIGFSAILLRPIRLVRRSVRAAHEAPS